MLAFVLLAQLATASPPIGTWAGTSTCLLDRGVCHDEVTRYHIARTGPDAAGVTPLRMAANKIVNGAEENMGTLDCTFTASTKMLVCPMREPQYRPGDWKFEIRGDSLSGGLWLPDGRQMRRVVAVRGTQSK